MSSRGDTVVKLKMTPYFWRLLGKYCIILSYRTVQRGQGRMSIMGTVSGIVANHLAKHAPWIDEEFERVRRELVVDKAAGFFGADYVDAVASCSSAQIPQVVRSHYQSSPLFQAIERAGPLLRADRKSKRAAGRPRKKTGALRDGSSGADPGASIGPEEAGVAHPGGAAPSGPRHPRLQPELDATATREEGGGTLADELADWLKKFGG